MELLVEMNKIDKMVKRDKDKINVLNEMDRLSKMNGFNEFEILSQINSPSIIDLIIENIRKKTTTSCIKQNNDIKHNNDIKQNNGTNNVAKNVEPNMPPTIPVPTECCAFAPAPSANTNGIAPKIKANDVITIGLNLSLAPSTAASRGVIP